jgi:hypothetical protein
MAMSFWNKWFNRGEAVVVDIDEATHRALDLAVYDQKIRALTTEVSTLRATVANLHQHIDHNLHTAYNTYDPLVGQISELRQVTSHIARHLDLDMAKVFIDTLDMPQPDATESINVDTL